MNKLKGSTGAKIVAWIICFLSIILFLGSAIGAYIMQEEGLYTETKAEKKEEVYQGISQNYSIAALAQMKEGDDPNSYFENTNFCYGIIQTDDISNVDLNKESSYVVRNFSEEVSETDLDVFSCDISSNTYFNNSNHLFGMTYYYYFEEDAGTYYSIDEAIYDTATGLFYYEVNGQLYPVQTVEFPLEVNSGSSYWEYMTFTYDREKNAYQNVSGYEIYNEIYGNSEVDESDAIAVFLKTDIVTFNMLDDTDSSYQDWGINDIYLDGYYSTLEDNLSICTLSENELDTVVSYDDYEVSSYQELYDNHTDEKSVTYTVVSYVPNTFVNYGNWTNGDLYVRAEILINLGYRMRYIVFVLMILSIITGLGSFIYLMQAAGHRKDIEDIVPMWMDKIPFDIYTAVIAVAEMILILIFYEYGLLSFDNTGSPFYIFLIAMMVLAGWILAMLFCLSFAVRFKLGKWWRNTIIGYILVWIGRCLSYLKDHISILWKSTLLLGGIAFVEFIAIVITRYDLGTELVFWFMEKVILYVAIVFGLIQMKKLQDAGAHIAAGDLNDKVDTKKMFWEFKKHGENLNHIGEGISKAVEERMKSEHFKTELITNVSHDIKTPLTSIINYVDLLEKEDLQNPTAQEYLEVLDRQSSRLKKLIEDLMEASKASTGNLSVSMELCEAGVFLVQTVGEFEEKTKAADLDLIIKKPEEPVYVLADGRHFWRVIDNLMNNICKYAQPGTRVYINLEVMNENVFITFRNTSKAPLNISSEELMERFVRGDSSRNTEGSGLGLNIAQNLTELMHGKMNLVVDGDLFKVVLIFQQADNTMY